MPTLITCPHCGAKNRVDLFMAQHTQPVCGRCRQPLPLPGQSAPASSPATAPAGDAHPVELTDATFDSFIAAAKVPVLVDMWAPWCGPCRLIAPILDQLAAESQGRYQVAKLNTEDNPRTAAALRVNAIPLLLIYRNGQLVDRLEGAHPKRNIVAALQPHLG